MIDSLLTSLGFSERAAKAYAVLASVRRATAQQIAKRASIPRASVYDILEPLIAEGLVVKEIARNTTHFRPADPHAFIRFIERQKDEQTRREQSATMLVQTLEQMFAGTFHKLPKLLYFEGKAQVESALYQYLPLWQKSYEKMNYFTMWGYQDHSFVEEYSRWHEVAWQNRNPKEEICLFSTKEAIANQELIKIPNRELRLLPEGITFPASIWVHADHIVLATTQGEPHYLILIIDSMLGHTLRGLFQSLWTLSSVKV